jgi:hypothetical protein
MIDRMGDKASAKSTMIEAVPLFRFSWYFRIIRTNYNYREILVIQ